jgi:ORF6N domain
VSSPNKHSAALTSAQVEQRIRVMRGQRVTLDSDLAQPYGSTTAALNQAVERNRERFPPDFAYQISLKEFRDLISQFVISNATRGGRRKLPWVFTEHGVAMLSSVLRSPTAVKVNIEIMRAFVRLRRLLATPGELVSQLRQLADTVQLHDDQIRVITEVLRRMAEPPPTPRGRIGFQTPPTPEPSKSSE